MEEETGLNLYGEIVVSVDDALDLVVSGYSGDIFCNSPEEVEKANLAGITTIKHPTKDLDLEEYYTSKVSSWLIPKEYIEMDIEQYLLGLADTVEKRTRVLMELRSYKKHGLLDMLKLMKYLVDMFKENNIVWGVGRGSSVASYILYLLEVHLVDSLKYDLDFREFIKEL